MEQCAARELAEETELVGELETVADPSGYPVFRAEVPSDATVHLGDEEHDRYVWVSLERAVRLLEPERVAQSLAAAAHGIV